MVNDNRTASANGLDRNPYVFVVGCSRSGTTVLRRMIDAHPQIAMFPHKSRWITTYFEKRLGLTPEGLVTPELVTRLCKYRRFRFLELAREDVETLIPSGEPITFADFACGVFDLYGQREGKQLVGDKTPRYVRFIPMLHAMFPWAKFVHLIRDGRDTSLSMLEPNRAERALSRFATWNKDPVVTAALRWEWNVRLGQEGGRPLGADLYYEMRYEALIHDPEGECAALCNFLDLPYDEVMVRFHEGRTRTKPGLESKKAWLPPTPGLRDWRSQMPAEDIERVEAAIGDFLVELDYPRGAPHPSPQALEHGARMRGMFNWRQMPEHW